MASDYFLKLYPGKIIYAYIKNDNAGSIKSFRKANFVFEKNTNISSGEVVEYWTGDDFNTKNENDNGTTVNHFPVNFSLSDGTTALHVAARYGHLSCLKKLIEVGSDFRIVDIHGNTPLLLSRKWGRTECENYLSGLQDACTFA